jgi:hypothetical protein
MLRLRRHNAGPSRFRSSCRAAGASTRPMVWPGRAAGRGRQAADRGLRRQQKYYIMRPIAASPSRRRPARRAQPHCRTLAAPSLNSAKSTYLLPGRNSTCGGRVRRRADRGGPHLLREDGPHADGRLDRSELTDQLLDIGPDATRTGSLGSVSPGSRKRRRLPPPWSAFATVDSDGAPWLQ